MGLESSANSLQNYGMGLYRKGFGAQLLNGLLWYYKLGEASGTRFDIGPNALNLTPNGTIGQGTGILGNAATFPGALNNNLINTFASQYDLSATDWTFTGWFNLDTKVTNQQLIYIGNGGILPANRVIDIEFQTNSDFIRVNISDGTNIGGVSSTIPTFGIPTGAWVFFVVRWDTTTQLLEIRLNDQDFDSLTMFNVIQSPGTQSFVLGTLQSGTIPLDGLMDEVGGWNRKLTLAEINFLYNGGSGNRPDLVLFVTNADGDRITNADGDFIIT